MNPPKMKLNGLYLLVALPLLASCTSRKEQAVVPPAADSVTVFALGMETVEKKIPLPATLQSKDRAELFAKVDGYVRALNVDIGSRVRKGDVLLVIDAPEVTADYARANADFLAAQARYHASRDTYHRTTRAAQEKGAVSDSELEQVKNQMKADSASYEAARSGANAYGQLREYLVIRAAFDGVITQRNVDPGILVGKSAQPMLVLENQRILRLRVAVPEAYTATVPESEHLAFTVDAEPTKTYQATLVRRSNEIDPRTRTERWEFEVVNSQGELKSGMYGTAQLGLRRKEPTFVIPTGAMVTTLERSFVIRVRDGKTEWVDVRAGVSLKDKIEIFGDLKAGDLIVARGTDELKPGTPVFLRM